MKKTTLLTSAAALLLVAGLFVSGCKKDDTTAPVVTLSGDASMAIVLNGTAPSDPGASASDDKDGSLTVTSNWSSTNPDVNKAATYTISYTATDAAGNVGTATRTVVVQNDAAYLEGTYACTEVPAATPWTQDVKASTTQNNKISFTKFGNYANNSTITAMIVKSGSDQYVVLSPASQSVSGIGGSGCSHVFASNGNGTVKIQQAAGKWTFSVNFTDSTTSAAGCTPSPSAGVYEDTFIHQ